jgi:hypothetical protein
MSEYELPFASHPNGEQASLVALPSQQVGSFSKLFLLTFQTLFQITKEEKEVCQKLARLSDIAAEPLAVKN